MIYKRAALFWLLQVARQREVRYIYKHFSYDNEEFQWNQKKYSIDNDYMWNTNVYFDLF